MLVQEVLFDRPVRTRACDGRARRRSGGEIVNGVTVLDHARAYRGYTLFCETFSLEGDLKRGKEALIYLIDMAGEAVHTWRVTGITVQSHCRLLPNGNLMVPTHDRSDISRGNVGLFELDPDGN